MKDHKSFEKKRNLLPRHYVRCTFERIWNILKIIWMFESELNIWMNAKSQIRFETQPTSPPQMRRKDSSSTRMSDLWNSRPALYFQRLWDFWDPTCFKPPSDSNTDFGQPTQIRRKRRCKFLINHWKGGLTLVSTTFS